MAIHKDVFAKEDEQIEKEDGHSYSIYIYNGHNISNIFLIIWMF